MPNKLFGELVQDAVNKVSTIAVPGREDAVDLAYLTEQIAILKKLMSTSYDRHSGLHIPMKEALWSADASILFPKVIQDILLRPKEPVMIGQSILAKTIRVDNVRSVEFPTIGAVRAKDIADGQDYPEVQPGFSEAMTEIKVGKSGLKLSVSEDVVNNSMWDVLALYIEQAGYAMLRHKEEKIFREFAAKAQIVFDNSNTSSSSAQAFTNGLGADGLKNGTLAFSDIIDAFGVLIANEYVPTDIILHPLAWTVFMKDPRLQYQLLQNTTGNAGYGPVGPDNVSASLPWNLNVAITPFTTFTSNDTALSSLPSTSVTNNTGPSTDIFICDRNNGIVILQKEDMQVDQWDDKSRDIMFMKFKESYGLGLLNGGKSAVQLKHIRIDDNFAPVYTTKTL